MSLEDAGLDGDGSAPGDLNEVAVEFLRLSGWRSFVETRPSAFAAISIKRELGNNQERAGRFLYIAIHFAMFIGEDSKPKYFVHEIVGVGGIVSTGNSKKDK